MVERKEMSWDEINDTLRYRWSDLGDDVITFAGPLAATGGAALLATNPITGAALLGAGALGTIGGNVHRYYRNQDKAEAAGTLNRRHEEANNAKVLKMANDYTDKKFNQSEMSETEQEQIASGASVYEDSIRNIQKGLKTLKEINPNAYRTYLNQHRLELMEYEKLWLQYQNETGYRSNLHFYDRKWYREDEEPKKEQKKEQKKEEKQTIDNPMNPTDNDSTNWIDKLAEIPKKNKSNDPTQKTVEIEKNGGGFHLDKKWLKYGLAAGGLAAGYAAMKYRQRKRQQKEQEEQARRLAYSRMNPYARMLPYVYGQMNPYAFGYGRIPTPAPVYNYGGIIPYGHGYGYGYNGIGRN